MIKKTLIIFSVFILSTTVFGQKSWKSPDYKAENYRSILVLAKVSDDLSKRQLEDKTVALLIAKGIKAIPAYSNVSEQELSNETVFMAKMDSLMVDGLITYAIKGTETEYKNTPSVGVNVGIPVRLGIFGGYIGTHVPLAGGAKTEQKLNINASFFNRNAESMQWSIPLSGKLKSDNSKLVENLARTTINTMISDQIFIQKK